MGEKNELQLGQPNELHQEFFISGCFVSIGYWQQQNRFELERWTLVRSTLAKTIDRYY